MSLFNINYDRLIKQLLPGALRKAFMFKWIRGLIIPVVYLYNIFQRNRNTNLYYLVHTSQVAHLQGVLTDEFGKNGQRILIDDDMLRNPVYTFLDTEGVRVLTYKDAEAQPVYLYTDAECTTGYYDFVVNVPSVLVYDVKRMKALINKYRLTSKYNYFIKTI